VNKDESNATQTAQATWVALSSSVMADAAGGQQVEVFIEGKREKRDEQQLDGFREYRLLSWEEASSGIGGRKTFPAWNNAICRVSRSAPEALPQAASRETTPFFYYQDLSEFGINESSLNLQCA
jgi:hypothetical protein